MATSIPGVYIVKVAQDKYKIGKANKSCSDRIRAQFKGVDIKVICIVSKRGYSPVKLEMELHARYKDRRLGGEFFKIKNIEDEIRKLENEDFKVQIPFRKIDEAKANVLELKGEIRASTPNDIEYVVSVAKQIPNTLVLVYSIADWCMFKTYLYETNTHVETYNYMYNASDVMFEDYDMVIYYDAKHIFNTEKKSRILGKGNRQLLLPCGDTTKKYGVVRKLDFV